MGTAAVVAFRGRRIKGKELQLRDLPRALLRHRHWATAAKAGGDLKVVLVAQSDARQCSSALGYPLQLDPCF